MDVKEKRDGRERGERKRKFFKGGRGERERKSWRGEKIFCCGRSARPEYVRYLQSCTSLVFLPAEYLLLCTLLLLLSVLFPLVLQSLRDLEIDSLWPWHSIQDSAGGVDRLDISDLLPYAFPFLYSEYILGHVNKPHSLTASQLTDSAQSVLSDWST